MTWEVICSWMKTTWQQSPGINIQVFCEIRPWNFTSIKRTTNSLGDWNHEASAFVYGHHLWKSFFRSSQVYTTIEELCLAVTSVAGSDFLINVPSQSDWNAIDVWTSLKVPTWCEFHPLSRFFVELLWNSTVGDIATRSLSSDPIECNVDFWACKLASAELIPRCSVYTLWHLRLKESWVYARRNQTLWTIRLLLKLPIESRNSLKFCEGLRSIKEENEVAKNMITVSWTTWPMINRMWRSRS